MQKIILQLLVLFFLFSCNDSEYPSSYKYSHVEVGDIGVFVLNQDLSPREISLFTAEELSLIRSNLLNEFENDVLIKEFIIESSETARIVSQIGEEIELSYVNNDGTLTFEMHDEVLILESTTDDKLKFCTEFFVASKGPITPESQRFNYNVFNLNSCEEMLTLEEGIEKIAHNYYHLDTFVFTFPKFVYQ